MADRSARASNDAQHCDLLGNRLASENSVPDNSAALFASLIICGLLYFGAVLIIPSDAAGRKDLDAHFFKEKGTVLGCIFLANVVA